MELLKLCRLCESNGIYEINIFKESEVSIAEELYRYCNLKLKNESYFPQKICDSCDVNFKNVKTFIETCLKTQENLKNIIKSRNTNGKKYTTEINKINEQQINQNNRNINQDLSEETNSFPILCENSITSHCENIEIGLKQKSLETIAKPTNININEDFKNDPSLNANISSLKIKKCKSKIKGPRKRNKVQTCPYCNKVYNSYTGWWNHVHTLHDKSKTVICDECGKTFLTKNHLNAHKAVHNTELSFECPQCPAKYKTRTTLNAHKRTHGQPFPCSVCNFITKTNFLLKKHMIVHSDERKYKCQICERDFKRDKSLKSHMKHKHKSI